MDIMKIFSRNDSFAKHAGVELLEVSKGKAKAQLKITKEHLNSFGTVHGGAIFTLADSVFAVACNSHGTVAVAINVNISYVKAVSEGILTAEAEEISLNPKIGNYLINITDQDGDLVAVFQGMAYRKKDMIPVCPDGGTGP